VLSCVGRGLGAGLISRPRSPTKCLKESVSKKENPTPEKGIRNNEKEEEEESSTRTTLGLSHYFVIRHT
jgi:hypothetical protein